LYNKNICIIINIGHKKNRVFRVPLLKIEHQFGDIK